MWNVDSLILTMNGKEEKMKQRLTTRMENGKPIYAEYKEMLRPDEQFSYGAFRKVVEKLAAYEDTGLEPETVKYMNENAETRLLEWCQERYGFPVGVLMDLIEAKREGRLVVLPCEDAEAALEK